MKSFWDSITAYAAAHVDGVIIAALLLVLAFVVSGLVKKLVAGLLNKTRLKEVEATARQSDRREPSELRREGLIAYLSKLAYLLVFLLFIPGIFSVLGVSAISDPISNLLNTIWGYVPNIISATVVLVAGTLIAKLVRELLAPVFRKINVDKLQEKAGIEVKDEARLSSTLAYIVYVLIIIPVLIAALQALKISVITEPAVAMLQKVLGFLPNIVVALILILIGTRIGKFTGQIVRQLISASGADARMKDMVGDKAPKFVLSATIGAIVRAVLDIFFVVEGVNVLKLDVLASVGGTVISYLPNVLAATLIVIAAFLLSAAAERSMERGGLKRYSAVARAAIMVVAAFMALNQLGIAAKIVNDAFIILLTAVGVAFAISFGLGSRGFATRVMDRLGARVTEEKDDEA